MKLLTIPEVADILKVTRVTVYRYIKCGRFPVHTIPAGMRVSEDDLNQWLQQTRVDNNAPNKYGMSRINL